MDCSPTCKPSSIEDLDQPIASVALIVFTKSDHLTIEVSTTGQPSLGSPQAVPWVRAVILGGQA